MSRSLNHGYGFNNRMNMRRDPIITYDVPQSSNIHLVFDDDRVMFEDERPIVGYPHRVAFEEHHERPVVGYPNRVVFEEHHASPVHKNHRHGSIEPRKQVHFVEHDERVIESVDNFGNQKVYKESVDSEADGFITRKHKNFELNKFGTFNYLY
ncbi:unnamed protein product [Lactuca virosa]|uniref:Uncharacterized protein n=1 Tax=Lactuca virosa TaxID=75947 RepID=A0AAU9MMW5_9ASTR|nr:unnamed protein product [Lactuca virosa]